MTHDTRKGGTMLNKTERRILSRLQEGRNFSTDDAGIREINAVQKLIDKGLATVVSRHSGVYYSRHGNGRTAYSKPHYYTAITVTLS